MSEIAKSIDECIKLGIAGFLKSHGFKKSGRTWHKLVADNWEIVNVQASSGNFGADGKFAVNIGVYQSEVENFCGNTLSGRPKESQSTIRQRLGSTENKSDFWWTIDAKSNLQQIANDVVSKLENHGLPWLDRHLSLKQLADSLVDQPSIHSFSAALLSGDENEAIKRVKAAVVNRPMAKAHFTRWANRAGLQI